MKKRLDAGNDELRSQPSAERLTGELLIEVAVYLYDKERLSMGQAKRLAGLNQIAFQKELAKRNVYIKLDVEDLERDLKNLELLK